MKALKIISFLLLIGLIWSVVEARLLFKDEQIFVDGNVPEVFDGYRIAFVADIHVGPYFSIGRLNHLVDEINAASPDLVVLGGDYVFLGREKIPALATALGRINATTLAVMGNHDNWEAPVLIRQELEKQGIMILDNDGFWIEAMGVLKEGEVVNFDRQRIRIAGVDDWQTAGSFLDKPLDGTSEEDLVILISHNPDVTYLLSQEKRVDLVLSGHTHGGQISFFGLFSPLVPIEHGQNYVSGWVNEDNFRVFISRGAGTTILPLRFFSWPQWQVITLERSE